jgi:5-methylthioribose kinase
MRRMIGFALVADIQSLELPMRLRAKRIVLAVARQLLVERGTIAGPADLAGVVRAALESTD